MFASPFEADVEAVPERL